MESGDGFSPEYNLRPLFALLIPQLLNLWVWGTKEKIDPHATLPPQVHLLSAPLLVCREVVTSFETVSFCFESRTVSPFLLASLSLTLPVRQHTTDKAVLDPRLCWLGEKGSGVQMKVRVERDRTWKYNGVLCGRIIDLCGPLQFHTAYLSSQTLPHPPLLWRASGLVDYTQPDPHCVCQATQDSLIDPRRVQHGALKCMRL